MTIYQARLARRTLGALVVSWLALAVFAVVALVCCTGCGVGRAQRVAQAQHGGSASGAGATLEQPNNSGSPTEQKATRKITVQAPLMPAPRTPVPELVDTANEAFAAVQNAGRTVHPPGAEYVPLSPPGAVGSAVLTIDESVVTRLGQHQDAGALIRAAEELAKWGWLRWVGVVSILAGVAGFLWSMGNPAGYPIVFAGVAGCGVVFVFASANPAWLLCIALPVGWYALQKVGVVKALT